MVLRGSEQWPASPHRLRPSTPNNPTLQGATLRQPAAHSRLLMSRRLSRKSYHIRPVREGILRRTSEWERAGPCAAGPHMDGRLTPAGPHMDGRLTPAEPHMDGRPADRQTGSSSVAAVTRGVGIKTSPPSSPALLPLRPAAG
ncbi:hypothetical protein NHX12_012039 [Muraenolepis orangiensis]|uniref:Uncharacterized protein n=1 Tax=Muraenolepis orangiensis TaxID=630683 RepID=A0A9Q0I9D7_9TELE|nr:hypothetical protein NHX12_012039 [Muraenolepis orangiensis]